MNTKKISIADVTLKQSRTGETALTFKEKIEIAKLLDRLHVAVIECAQIVNKTVDSLLIKSYAAVITDSVLSLPVGTTKEELDTAWQALKEARHPRLQVEFSVSPAQMEYFHHKKPAALLDLIASQVGACRALCADVEFIAKDATRCDPAFLASAVSSAIEAGATTVTISDDAGTLLPEELRAHLAALKSAVPALSGVRLGVQCTDELHMACASLMEAVLAGAVEVKTAIGAPKMPTGEAFGQILRLRGDDLKLSTTIAMTEMQRVTSQINWILCGSQRGRSSFATDNVDNVPLSAEDDLASVTRAVQMLGYDLSADDMNKVYDAFCRIAAKKSVGPKELEAIVATTALQVPPTYRLDSFVINSGNIMSSTANIALSRGDHKLTGISIGDGPIDAAFLAIEQIVGHHYELDDFQIQSVTEGREAVGSALVRLRSNGKLYSGQGVSTDIIGASINAYLNALNKIVFEEEN